MKNFVRRIENFECEICGNLVKGDGYTDHCPHCLYGKHVDETVPGDRKSACGGLMEPVGIRKKKGKLQIEYRCQKCGKVFFCKTSKEDEISSFPLLFSPIGPKPPKAGRR